MKEKTLVLLKPDAVQRGLIGEIISRFERCGLKIVGMKMQYASPELAGEHYAEDEEWMKTVGSKMKESYAKKGVEIKETEMEIGAKVRNQLMDFISMSPVIALCLEGHNAVKHVRKLVGATAPSDSAPGTIRGDFSFETYQMADNLKRPIQNLIHASGEVEEAKREVPVWFDEEEIFEWEHLEEVLLYREG
ncbi:MAG: nucleoside-diphosphate kinase [Candidatus Woesearchaeota archaeon]